MPARKRFRDAHSAGKSKIVPRLSNENWKDRHKRRKQVAVDNSGKVNAWCKKNGFNFQMKNKNDHWIFLNPNNKCIEWFPSTGKLVIGKKWRQGIHVHDVYQLMEVLERCKEDKI